MTDFYVLLKLAHVVGACVLLGTGIGIAFFMWMADRSGEAGFIAATARVVVIADTIFTATAVVAQPVTGVALAGIAGTPLSSPWIVASLVLYGLIGACWLPVLWCRSSCAISRARHGMPAHRCQRDTTGCFVCGSSWAGRRSQAS